MTQWPWGGEKKRYLDVFDELFISQDGRSYYLVVIYLYGGMGISLG